VVFLQKSLNSLSDGSGAIGQSARTQADENKNALSASTGADKTSRAQLTAARVVMTERTTLQAIDRTIAGSGRVVAACGAARL
jgi:hypothetical protein